MIDNNASNRNRLINGILLVAAFGLLAASIYSVYLAWRTGLAQSRAETASRLMAIRTSPRSTETPGINAWVSWSLLHRFEASAESDDPIDQWVIPRSDSQFPVEFRPLLNSLQETAISNQQSIQFKTDREMGGRPSSVNLEFRTVRFIEMGKHHLVVTARKTQSGDDSFEPFSELVANRLGAIQQEWNDEEKLPRLESSRLQRARVARFYLLDEMESLYSLPIGPGNANDLALCLSEGEEFRKNPLSPTFVSNPFFFNFQYDRPLETQAVFSGMYLDLGGLGLVASVITPVIIDGRRCVLGADIAFDMDWKAFSKNLSSNLESHVIQTGLAESGNWNRWLEFRKRLPESATRMRQELKEIANRETFSADAASRKSIYLATAASGGNVTAIQVNRTDWLLLYVPPNEIQLPWATMVLTSVVFFCLFFRIEHSRRKAIRLQNRARNELQQKQNLLDTMQVPLMVVDPNTDEIVYCNRAASAIGMQPGTSFGKDFVADNVLAREQYLRTQTLGEEHRRAYGVPIRVNDSGRTSDSSSVRHAIVRSVAVTAPIETLKADERHRLGILFLIDENVDLPLLLGERLAHVRQDEKRKLSGLLNHGVDSFARVLRDLLETDLEDPTSLEVASWMTGYLSDRIQLVSWVLENWNSEPLANEWQILEQANVMETVQRYEKLFRIVSANRRLRERLHWNNGMISGKPLAEIENWIRMEIDWDQGCCFSIPREGVFGFLVGEFLINAVRHGKSGSHVQLNISQDRTRNELVVNIENPKRDSRVVSTSKPYGGIKIAAELARLAGWQHPEHLNGDEVYRVTIRIPTSIRKTEYQAD